MPFDVYDMYVMYSYLPKLGKFLTKIPQFASAKITW